MEEKKYSERVVIRVITAMLIELVVLGAVFGVYVFVSKKECAKECTCNNKAVDNNTSKVPDTDDDNVIVQLESDDVYDDAISVDIYSVGKYSDNARVLINGQELINDAPGYIDYVFIYKIDDVYVLRMNNTTDQCGTDYILLFNDKGQVLFDYTKYQSTTLKVDKVNKVVTVDVYEGEDCWCCEGMNINKDTRTIKIDGKNAVLEK